MQKPTVTLDQAVILGEVQELRKTVEDVRRALEELKERVVRTEADLSIIESSYHAIYNALEINGLMSAGEPTKPVAKPEPIRETWDPAKVKWTTAEGSKGQYERSEDANNLEFKKMLQDLAAHKGKLSRDGYFYWTFQNGATVGRKR